MYALVVIFAMLFTHEGSTGSFVVDNFKDLAACEKAYSDFIRDPGSLDFSRLLGADVHRQVIVLSSHCMKKE